MSAPTDQEMAAKMLELAQSLELNSADGRAGAGAILREIEAMVPGTLTRMQAAVDIHQAAKRSQPGHA